MATNTYVALDKVTVGTATPSITFTGISGVYTDLVIVTQSKTASGALQLQIQVGNGSVDTGANYSGTQVEGTGSSALSRNWTGQNYWQGYYDYMDTADGFMSILNIMNYSNTTTFKTMLNRAGNANTGTVAQAGLWRSTSAINTVKLFPSGSGSFAAGSTFSLYGIAAEGVSPAAKATGGAIYSDSTYYYHVFDASGTFTPTQSITADCLVVAGGGGGGAGTNGSNGGGGGGAGGLLAFTSQSLTATGYSITVGGGGTGNGSTGVSTNGGDSQFAALTLVKGGGAGGSNYNSLSANWPGATGGSGGGGYGRAAVGGSATSSQGFAGGTGGADSGVYAGAGGGGAGAVGAAGNSGSAAGNGGIGSTTYSSWGVATGIGQNVSGTYYLAGGGAGGSYASTVATGGSGGGGNGGASGTVAVAGTAATGGGGGASGGSSTGAGTGKNGGSGVVIVRYLKA